MKRLDYTKVSVKLRKVSGEMSGSSILKLILFMRREVTNPNECVNISGGLLLLRYGIKDVVSEPLLVE